MRNRTKLFLALPLLLGIAAGGAHAQLTKYNFDQATSAMISSNNRAARVGRVDYVPSVTLVRLRQRVVFGYEDDVNVPSIEITAQKHAAGIARVRGALKANPATREALAARGVPIGRIVAVDVFSNGALRVYIL